MVKDIDFCFVIPKNNVFPTLFCIPYERTPGIAVAPLYYILY